MKDYDLIVIGGGPAGLSAALAGKEAGLLKVLVVERAARLGGILPQCIHPGFGMRLFGSELTGPEYAHRLTELVYSSGIEVMTDTAVISIKKDRKVITAGKKTGISELSAKALVLATGCRERPIGSLPVTGTRPSGVFTAGSAQKMVNISGYDVGNKIVILGSGDVGLIMARRFSLLGKKVLAVVEKEDDCGGLLRNRFQCLDDFGIPLLTGHTISEVYGKGRITGVKVCPVDREGKIISHSGQIIECDTLITSVGLIPETELAAQLSIPVAGGLIKTNQSLQTSLPWLFVCGNARCVHDLADDVSDEGRTAGLNAAGYIKESDSPLLEIREISATPGKKLRSNQLVCLSCPESCVLTVENGSAAGGKCEKGKAFASNELEGSKRILTATVKTDKGLLPVRSSIPIPIASMRNVVSMLNNVKVSPPVSLSQVILKDVSGTGADIISAAEIK